MTVLKFNRNNYKLLLNDLALSFGMQGITDDCLILEPPNGSGVLKAITLQEEVEVLIADVSFSKSLMTIREQSDLRYFVLHFDDVYINQTATFKVDHETLKKTQTHHSVARLTCNIFLNTEIIPANAHIKSVKILIPEKWLKKYLNLQVDVDILQRYLQLKTESFDIEPLNDEYLKLLNEVWTIKKEGKLQHIAIQNRITQLIELFFTRLYNKSDLVKGHFKLAPQDIDSLLLVEKLLVKDFSKAPPTIEEFSKIVSISSSKLKKIFRIMFGESIYAYYQKLRIEKASELLQNGDYTIKKTAEAIGYNNIANFNLAFKKQFNTLPANFKENNN